MSSQFVYYFDDDKEFYYDYDIIEAIDYITQTHGVDDILKDYIDSGLYDKETEDDKKILATYDDFDGTYESIDNMSEDTKTQLANEVVYDLIVDEDFYDDELTDYFEQDAYDQYEAGISIDDEERNLSDPSLYI